jgi:hypothetical protein
VPLQLPDHPEKIDVGEGAAVSVTLEYAVKRPPLGLDAAGLNNTLPLPSPDFVTVREYRELSVAATVAGAWLGATTSGPIVRLSSTAFAASRRVTLTEIEHPVADPLRSRSERQGAMSTLTRSCCEFVEASGICSSNSATDAPFALAYVTRTWTEAVVADC